MADHVPQAAVLREVGYVQTVAEGDYGNVQFVGTDRRRVVEYVPPGPEGCVN